MDIHVELEVRVPGTSDPPSEARAINWLRSYIPLPELTELMFVFTGIC